MVPGASDGRRSSERKADRRGLRNGRNYSKEK
jgi:hypothetical protein